MFRDVEYYKPGIERTVAQARRAHDIALSRSGESSVTFRALPPSDDAVKTSDLNLLDYDFAKDVGCYADDWLRALETSMDARRQVADNFIPNISPMLGIGDFSAFVAGDIYFAKDTSWSKPSLSNLADFKKLPALGSSQWYGRFLDLSEYMLKRTRGTGIPFMRGFFSPLDLAEALRGEGIYYDFYDEPKLLHEFLDYCADCIIIYAKDLYGLCEKYLGTSQYGTFFLDGVFMSEDIACMISADLYREFCAPHTQKVIDAFGKGYMHCHSRAMYLVKEICLLNHVATLWLATDPNQPRPIDNLETLTHDANSVCLNIDCDDFSEIEHNEEQLKKGNFSICLPVSGIKEAEVLTKRFERIFGE